MSISGKLGFVKERGSSISSIDETIAKKETEIQAELQKAISETTTTQAQTGTTATEATKASQAAAESQQQAKTTALDAETQSFIKDLLASLGEDFKGDEESLLSTLSQTLANKATTAQADISAQITPIIEEARLKGEQELQKLQTQLAQQAGGSIANTLVASSTGVARSTLETSLAAERGRLELAGREQSTAELTAALSGAAQAEEASQFPIQNISSLLNILKGASVEQTTAATQTSTEESKQASQTVSEQLQQSTALTQSQTTNELVRILDSLTNRKALEVGQTKGQKLTGSISASNAPSMGGG